MKLKYLTILVAVFLLACCVIAPVSANFFFSYTNKEIDNDFRILDNAYKEMVRMAPTEEIRDLYLKARESGFKFRDALKNGNMGHDNNFDYPATLSAQNAFIEVMSRYEMYSAYSDEVLITKEETLFVKAIETYDVYETLWYKHVLSSFQSRSRSITVPGGTYDVKASNKFYKLYGTAEMYKDYLVVNDAYNNMILQAPTEEIKDAYLKAKKAGLRFRNELPKGFMEYNDGYKSKAAKMCSLALREVKIYVDIYPTETELRAQAYDADRKYGTFARRYQPAFVNPFCSEV